MTDQLDRQDIGFGKDMSLIRRPRREKVCQRQEMFAKKLLGIQLVLGGFTTPVAGVVLGNVTENGKYTAIDPTAVDGSEVAAGILYGAVDASAADAEGGVPGLFRQYNTPANFVETANTIGLPRYAKQAVDQQFGRWVMLHVQSNPLPICTRPRVLIKGKRK